MARLVLRPGSGGSRDTLFVATRNAGTNLFALEMLWAFDASAVVLRHASGLPVAERPVLRPTRSAGVLRGGRSLGV